MEHVKYLFTHKSILLIVAIAFVLTLFPIIFDGQTGCVDDTCGFIIGTNYRDGIWFQAVAETSFRSFPFQMPNFAGEALRGYHYLPNLATYFLTFLGIPVAFTFYKIIPIIYMIGITILAIQLARTIQNNIRFISIFLFFLLFGMHLSMFTSIYHHGEIRNGALINTFQATRILESPHLALALLGLLYIVTRLYKGATTFKDHAFFAIILFFTMGTKFYVAFSLAIILGIYEIITTLQTKNVRGFFISGLMYFTSASIAILLFYDPFSTSATGAIFTFSPFTTVHHLIESPDLFHLEQMVLARYFLYEAGWSPRLLLIELFSSFLFVLFYFGTRICALFFFFSKKNITHLKPIEIAVSGSIILSLVMAIGFVQKGDWFNPIQFAVPAAYLSVIFLSQWLYGIISKKPILGTLIFTLLILVTFPANLVNLTYLGSKARFVIAQNEVDALRFLKNAPPGSVFAPIDENDTAYVSAFSGKPTYFNFSSVLPNAGYNEKTRSVLAENFTQNIDVIYTNYLYFKTRNMSFPIDNPCFSRHYSVIYDKKLIRICQKKV